MSNFTKKLENRKGNRNKIIILKKDRRYKNKFFPHIIENKIFYFQKHIHTKKIVGLISVTQMFTNLL